MTSNCISILLKSGALVEIIEKASFVSGGGVDFVWEREITNDAEVI